MHTLAASRNRDKYSFGPERSIPMCVYRIKEKSTGKVYIGQSSKHARYRWLNHLYKHGDKTSIIKRALLKHGRESFEFSVIDIAETQEQLNHKEAFWIAHFNSITPLGFNLLSGGGGLGKHSQETIEKLREIALDRHRKNPIPMGINAKRALRTPEEVAAVKAAKIAAQKGKPTWLSTNKLSEESLSKMRASKTGVAVPKKYKSVVRSDGVEFESVQSAALALGCDRKLISQALGKRQCKAAGYYFSYKEVCK